jgi:hemolysin activation/secretion protein
MQKTTSIGILALLTTGLALAIEADHLNLQTAPLPTYLKPGAEPNFSLPPVAPDSAVIVSGAQTILLERVLFVGNTAVSSQDLQAVAAPFVGKPIGAADIETLRQNATLLYVERGYVNSGVVLGPEPLNHGTLTLHIIEGRLKEIRLHSMFKFSI